MRDLELGVVGNAHVAALIDEDGDIVWWPFPRVDGDPLFSSLLAGNDPPEGGFCRVDLEGPTRTEQSYERNTAILRTVLEGRNGERVEITDFAPRFKQFDRIYRPLMLVRRIRPLAGHPCVTVRVRPRGDYGTERPDVTYGSHHVRYVFSSSTLRLTTNASVTNILEERAFLLDREVILVLGADESITRSLEELAETFHRETRLYWEGMVPLPCPPVRVAGGGDPRAITLKLCEYEDTGAIVAALTTSIP
jgi:GH15 family glucan-1,4-alpha-glucosidase